MIVASAFAVLVPRPLACMMTIEPGRTRGSTFRSIVAASVPSGSPETTSHWMTTDPAAPSTATALRRERQLALYKRALESLPGGTNSNFRAWGESTVYIDRGKGGSVWDIDGNEFIDLRMGYGPVILGHGDDRVDDYVNERMRRGVSFSLTTEDEVRTIELIKELTGWVQKARMTVSGTEATMHAMRIARAYTGRSKIVKFEGQYHGVHDCPTRHAERGRLGDPTPGRLVGAVFRPRRRNDHPGALQQYRCPAAPVRGAGERSPRHVEPVLGNAQGSCRNPASTRRCER